MYTLLRAIGCDLRVIDFDLWAIKLHECRDQASEATENPRDEDTGEKPDVIVRPAVPERTQSDGTDAAAREADCYAIG